MVEARRGGQGPDRRSRPSTRQCGRGSCPPTTRRASAVWATRSVVHASASVLAVVKARTGAAGRPHVSVGGGLVHGPSGGDRGQRPQVGISREARERLCAAKSSELHLSGLPEAARKRSLHKCALTEISPPTSRGLCWVRVRGKVGSFECPARLRCGWLCRLGSRQRSGNLSCAACAAR